MNTNMGEQAEPPELCSPKSPDSLRAGDVSLVQLDVRGVQSPLHASQHAHKLKSPASKNKRDPQASKAERGRYSLSKHNKDLADWKANINISSEPPTQRLSPA